MWSQAARQAAAEARQANAKGNTGGFALTRPAAHQAGVEKVLNGPHTREQYSNAMTSVGYQNWKAAYDKLMKVKLK